MSGGKSTVAGNTRTINDGPRLKVMIVGPGPKTEGGITEVIRTITTCFSAAGEIDFNWISTHRSGGAGAKLMAVIGGLLAALKSMPSTDLVHIHSSAQISFYRKSLFFWLAKLCRRPVIWHLHSPDRDFVEFFGQGGMRGRYIQSIMSRCDRVVVLSDNWRELAARTLPRARIVAIYNPIPAVSDDVFRDQGPHTGRILYLAHLIQRKGYPFLIRAFAQVCGDFPQSRLVFAGSGELDEAKQLCDELGITDRVDYLGWIQEPGRSDELRNADIFALPSYQEGLPMGVLEAMAYGLGVVTTPVGGIPDLVVHRKNGMLVEAGCVEPLAAALRELLAKPDFCAELGRSARTTVASIAPHEIASQWLQLYREVSQAMKLSREAS